MLQAIGVGAAVDAESAVAASRLVDDLVDSMPIGSRVLRDGTIDTEERRPQPVTEIDESWYGASREVLETFSAFSSDSGGFVVL